MFFIELFINFFIIMVLFIVDKFIFAFPLKSAKEGKEIYTYNIVTLHREKGND